MISPGSIPPDPSRSLRLRHSFRKSVSIYPRSFLNQSLPPPSPSPRNKKFLDTPLGVPGNTLYIQFTCSTTASLQQRKPLLSCVLLAKITSPKGHLKVDDDQTDALTVSNTSIVLLTVFFYLFFFSIVDIF